jgi:hypothetical protein
MTTIRKYKDLVYKTPSEIFFNKILVAVIDEIFLMLRSGHVKFKANPTVVKNCKVNIIL